MDWSALSRLLRLPSAASDAQVAMLDSWATMPDLLVIDGGKGHVTGAMEVLQELGIDVPVVGVAKEDHSSTSQYEELWLPFAGEPLILPRGSQGLYLIQRIRDEAHRFAITYHRQVRSGKTFKSLLDEIPGIGPKRRKPCCAAMARRGRLARPALMN